MLTKYEKNALESFKKFVELNMENTIDSNKLLYLSGQYDAVRYFLECVFSNKEENDANEKKVSEA